MRRRSYWAQELCHAIRKWHSDDFFFFFNDLRCRQSVQPILLSNMYHDICFVLTYI
jgi:hypothetical protein